MIFSNFRRKPAALAVVSALCMLPASANAAQQIYFHKPHVELTDFTADVATCRDLVEAVKTPQQPSAYSPNLYATAAASFLSGLMGSKQRRRITESVLRTCMADKGYRRVEMDDALEKQFSGLQDMPRLARLYALASADHANGKVLPR